MPILSRAVARYLHEVQPRRSGVLREIEETAWREGMPPLPPITARFIATLVRALDPSRILEIGTGYGFTTLQMARVCSGHITTVEYNHERATKAQEFFHLAGISQRVEVLQANAHEVDLGSHDIAILDASRVDQVKLLRRINARVVIVPGTMIWGLAAKEYESEWRSEMEAVLVSVARAINAQADLVLPIGGGVAMFLRSG